MNRQDVYMLKKALCPHDEDYEKACISPHNLEIVFEQLLLENNDKEKNNMLSFVALGLSCLALVISIASLIRSILFWKKFWRKQ